MNETTGMRKDIALMAGHQQKSASAVHSAHTDRINRCLGQVDHVDDVEHRVHATTIRIDEDFDGLTFFRRNPLILGIPLFDIQSDINSGVADIVIPKNLALFQSAIIFHHGGIRQRSV